MAWRSAPAEGATDAGVVLLPPIGYEYWTAHRTLRVLAETWAAAGRTVLRVDYDGTGDSAGEGWDPRRLPAWRADVATAAEELRRAGVRHLTIAGLRLGATLALLESVAVGADAVVAWAPVVSGRRYARELRLLSRVMPGHGQGMVLMGTVLTEETQADLARIDLLQMTTAPPAALVVDRDDRPPSAALVEHLRSLGCPTDHLVRPGTDLALDQPTEYATVPEALVAELAARLDRPARLGDGAGFPGCRRRATVGDGGITEEIVTLGQRRLAGVLTSPATAPAATVVWLNSGSEPHVGPGRAWVEYARALARAGYASVRVDFTGWGESPDGGRAPGRPYDTHTLADTREVVAALVSAGHDRVVLAGLCAGAWVALRVATDTPLGGVIAINPQLYWQPGDPVEADIAKETHVRRRAEIARFKRGSRWHLWDALDTVGVHHPASTWLRDLAERGTPTLMLFAAGDDGLEFLEDRVGRAWRRARRGPLRLAEIPDIDHPMHDHWRRPAVVDTIRDWLELGSGPAQHPARTGP